MNNISFLMKQYTFPAISTSWRVSGAIDLHDGTKNVFFIRDSVRQSASEIVLPESAACANCTELRRERDEYMCAPFRLSGKLKWSYNPAFLADIDREKAVCPLYSSENPPIVELALAMLWNTYSNDAIVSRALDTIWKFPNAKFKE